MSSTKHPSHTAHRFLEMEPHAIPVIELLRRQWSAKVTPPVFGLGYDKVLRPHAGQCTTPSNSWPVYETARQCQHLTATIRASARALVYARKLGVPSFRASVVFGAEGAEVSKAVIPARGPLDDVVGLHLSEREVLGANDAAVFVPLPNFVVAQLFVGSGEIFSSVS